MPVTYQKFKESLSEARPPETWSEALRALWWDAKGNWNSSHDIAQDIPGTIGSWIHAYLHRKEGDLWNAEYWYRRAGLSLPETDLEKEAEAIIRSLLKTQR